MYYAINPHYTQVINIDPKFYDFLSKRYLNKENSLIFRFNTKITPLLIKIMASFPNLFECITFLCIKCKYLIYN